MEKNKKLMIVIIALLVVLMAIVVGVSVVAYRLLNSAAEPQNVTVEVGEIDFMNSYLISLSSPMTINLLPGPGGSSHAINLSLTIAIDASDEKNNADLIAKISGSEAIIRDAIIFVISNKTVDQIGGGPVAQDLLKEEILLRLQDEFKTNIIHAVYFNDFYFM